MAHCMGNIKPTNGMFLCCRDAMLTTCVYYTYILYIDGLVQERRNSCALSIEKHMYFLH